MHPEAKTRFIAQRAHALAIVLLTRRDDLVVTECRGGTGPDCLVDIRIADEGRTSFGVYIAGTMASGTLPNINRQLKPILDQVHSFGPFSFPVCVFYYDVRNDNGYSAWAYEPVVTPEGEQRLSAHSKPNAQPLGNESLDEIISQVKRWNVASPSGMVNGRSPGRGEGTIAGSRLGTS